MLDNFSEKLARIEARIGELTLELNRLVWETYFDYAEQARIVPDIMTYPGLDYSALCDTVSAIAYSMRSTAKRRMSIRKY